MGAHGILMGLPWTCPWGLLPTGFHHDSPYTVDPQDSVQLVIERLQELLGNDGKYGFNGICSLFMMAKLVNTSKNSLRFMISSQL